MKLWSRGLGRTEVEMDFRYYKVAKKSNGNEVTIVGKMHDPVNWEFWIKMEPEDIAGVMKMFFTPAMVWYIIKNAWRYFIYLFNRKKFQERDGEDLETKIMTAYDNMVNKPKRGRPTRSSRVKKRHNQEETEELNDESSDAKATTAA